MAKQESIVEQLSQSVAEKVSSQIAIDPLTAEKSLEALLGIKNLLGKMIDPNKTVQQDQKFPGVFFNTFEKVLSNLKETSINFKSIKVDSNKKDSNTFFDAVAKIPGKIEEKIANKAKDIAYSFVPKAIKSKVLSFTGTEQDKKQPEIKQPEIKPLKDKIVDVQATEQKQTNEKSDSALPFLISKGFKSVVEAITNKLKGPQTSSDTAVSRKSLLETKAEIQKVEVTNFKDLSNILPSIFDEYFKKINTNLKEIVKLLGNINEKDFGGEGSGGGVLDTLRNFLPGRKGKGARGRNTRTRNKKATQLKQQRAAYKAGQGPKPTLAKPTQAKSSSIPTIKTPKIIGDTVSKVGKGLSKAAPILGKVGGVATGALFAGMEFAGRKAEGQTTTQAAVGTGAGVAGAAAGAIAGQLLIPIPIVGAVIGGMVGGWLAGKASDKAMGVDDPVTRWKNRTESTTDGKKLIEAFSKLPKDKQNEFGEMLAPTLENPEVIAPTDEIIRAELSKIVAFQEKEKKAKEIEKLPPIAPIPVKEAVADQTLKTKEIPVSASTASIPLEKPEQKFTPIAMDKVPPIAKESVSVATNPLAMAEPARGSILDVTNGPSAQVNKEIAESPEYKAGVQAMSELQKIKQDIKADQTKAIQSGTTENKLKDTIKSTESSVNNEALKQTATESTKQTQLLTTLVGNMNENFGRIASAFREAGINFKEVKAPVVVQQNAKQEGSKKPTSSQYANLGNSDISNFRINTVEGARFQPA